MMQPQAAFAQPPPGFAPFGLAGMQPPLGAGALSAADPAPEFAGKRGSKGVQAIVLWCSG